VDVRNPKSLPYQNKNIPLSPFLFTIVMPLISMEYDDLIDLLGEKVEMEKLIEMIPMMGADIGKIDYTQMDIEFFPDRPDLYSVEGLHGL